MALSVAVAILGGWGLYVSVIRNWDDYMVVDPEAKTLRFKVGRSREQAVDLSQLIAISSRTGKGLSAVIITFRGGDGGTRRFVFDVRQTPGVHAWFNFVKDHEDELRHVLTKSGREIQSAVETPEGD